MLDERAYFLDVSRSATGRAWVDRLDANTSRIAQAISQRTDLSEILSRIVAGRGIGPDEAESFLNPTIRDLMPDPSTMTAMDKLVAR
ncbi:MAG: single-stranded-DNA-specific exonuclease RecJ, partial [Devosia nanyangense]|nr:single-stranded-DNA-specific exonuclease RecJ [Devosia nanyangense]